MDAHTIDVQKISMLQQHSVYVVTKCNAPAKMGSRHTNIRTDPTLVVNTQSK